MIWNEGHRAPIAAGIILTLLNAPYPTASASEESTLITWRLPREQIQKMRDELQLKDGTFTPDETTQDDTKGLPLIYFVAGVVTLPALVSAIATAVRDVWCGGVLVEETDDGLTVSCEPSISIGTVVVRDKNGVKVHQSDNFKDPSPLLKALGKLRS